VERQESKGKENATKTKKSRGNHKKVLAEMDQNVE